MSKRNRSKSGAKEQCPECGRKLRGVKGLRQHLADEHGIATEDGVNVFGSGPAPIEPREG